MAATRILFLGGTGTISSACVRRSLLLGHDVTVLNRGSGRRPVPDGVRELVADIRDADAVQRAVGQDRFDVIAQFLAFTPQHVQSDLAGFEGHCGQYVFISSASAYQKPPQRLPVTESTPLRNPFWQYSRDKIACEDLLVEAYRDRGFPVTIVRPSHTYDERLLPTMGGWTDISRMRRGKPVVIHGDGTSLWTLTHSDDFAVGFTGLLANPAAIGEAFTITGTHAPTWNQIYRWLADAAGVPDPDFVHVASEAIAARSAELGPGLLGDKSHSMLFDIGKVTALVPEFRTTITFDEGARRILAHFDAHPAEQAVDAERDAVFDGLAAYARS
ncbi:MULTISPECIES: SDR family oxidoreductase [unclassified Microbacterium]|uniref:SDR family oxidoreductase n=1 Tax=unclassified Microbacterium TaxID=2609290 RepID=UPI00214CCF1F|nr:MULTISPECIES: SDR family oxidoreductase [unclassified Microbacterium]MCR2809663.1 SDR family oxidoreductase [Microbacterium sp. zg.B185]WIM18015.1 SDR family oxidoreductase [Microbacterium sp. zg-B185]